MKTYSNNLWPFSYSSKQLLIPGYLITGRTSMRLIKLIQKLKYLLHLA